MATGLQINPMILKQMILRETEDSVEFKRALFGKQKISQTLVRDAKVNWRQEELLQNNQVLYKLDYMMNSI